MKWAILFTLALVGLFSWQASAQNPTPADAEQSLVKVVRFAHEKVAKNGGYVYLTSSDLSLREAEGIPGPDTVWVQPPGTPSVGAALLRAYQASGNEKIREAAYATAMCLTRGQLQSGGWYYQIHFDPAERAKWMYRRDLAGKLQSDPTPAAAKQSTGG